MKPKTADLAQVAEALGALREEIARLGARVAALEAMAPRAPTAERPTTTAAAPPVPSAAAAEELPEELVVVIAAALAAYFGKRPKIRQIRLLGSAAWNQQGRVTIQASHALAHHMAGPRG
jgi:methylmalonyl-CoA carboxyltransferase large subunit